MIRTQYIRKARHEWRCCKCGRRIKSGETYQDIEIKEYYPDDVVTIRHERSCLCCPVKPIFVLCQSEPVIFKDVKEWLVGKGYDREGRKRLLTQDWDHTSYHWRAKVKDSDGNSLYFGNVRFVNA